MGNYFSAISSLFFFIALVSCSQKKDENPKNEGPFLKAEYNCGAEVIYNPKSKYAKLGSKKTGLFNGVNLRTDKTAYEGNYSLEVNKSNPYGFGTKFIVENGNYIEATIWRKKCESCGNIILKTTDNKKISASNFVIEENGDWERILVSGLVKGDVFDSKIKAFYFNGGKQSNFVDNFQIKVFREHSFPNNFPELEHLQIQIDKKDLVELNKHVEEAKGLGVLLPHHKKKYKAKIKIAGEEINAKVRLKGDWTDHLNTPKWSFRIEIQDEKSVLGGLKEFSVQNPRTRHFSEELFLHQLANKVGLLSTRYGYIQVSLNDENKGLYAYEEHFTKQLIESKKRREGPIVKFDEEPFWNTVRFLRAKPEYKDDVFVSYAVSQPIPFGKKKTIKNSNLYNQFIEANILMNQYKSGNYNADELFDLNKLALLMAIEDFAGVGHGLAWHNQRMYYNPVLNKLEPILYDALHSNWPIKNLSMQQEFFEAEEDTFNRKPSKFLTSTLYTQPVFQKAYLNAMSYISGNEFSSILDSVISEVKGLDTIINKEFSYYTFNAQVFKKRQADVALKMELIKEKADKLTIIKKEVGTTSTEHFIKGINLNVFIDSIHNNTINFENYHNVPVKLEYLVTKQKVKVELSGVVSKFDHQNFVPGKLSQTYQYGTDIDKVYYTVDGSNKTYKATIYPWPKPSAEAKTTLQTYRANASLYIPHQVNSDTIVIKKGNYTLDKPLVILEGKTVKVEAGVTIDLVNNAKIICFDNMLFAGQEDNPITVTSSDKTGQGLFVLQAEKKSVVKHTNFTYLNTSLDRFWTLTGAVTFYESDVDMNHVNISHNSCEDALNIVRSHFNIDGLTISETWGDGFDADYCTGLLKNSTYINTGNDCIDFSTSEISIDGVEIKNSGDKGISGGEASTLQISNVNIDGAVIGIASKDKSELYARNISVKNAKYGLAAFRKKPEYGSATITAADIKLENVDEDYILELNSTINLNGKFIVGEKKLDIDKLYEL